MSRQNFRFASTASMLALGLMLAPLQAGAQEVGVNTAVRNEVLVRQAAGSAARQAAVRQRVRIGNAISTGRQSGLQVTLFDRTTFTMGPNAQLTVDRFIYDPDAGSSVTATAAKGTFRFLSGSGRRGANQLNTPSASIGIRGTVFEVAIGQDALDMAHIQGLEMGRDFDPQTATMAVLRGPGPLAPQEQTRGVIDITSGGTTVSLNRPGLAAFVPWEGAQPVVFEVSNEAFQAFDTLLRTAPESFEPISADFARRARDAGAMGSVAEWAAARAGITFTPDDYRPAAAPQAPQPPVWNSQPDQKKSPQRDPQVIAPRPQPPVYQAPAREPKVQYREPEVDYYEPPVQYREPEVDYYEPPVQYREPEVDYYKPPFEYSEPEGTYQEPEGTYQETEGTNPGPYAETWNPESPPSDVSDDYR